MKIILISSLIVVAALVFAIVLVVMFVDYLDSKF